MRRSPLGRCLLRRVPAILFLATLAAGCDRGDAIRHYKVARPAPSHRLLGAVILREDQAWFFKLTGSNERLEPLVQTFHRLIQSVRFSEKSAGSPEWTLPAGWQQEQGPGMRFATIKVDAQGAVLELAVTRLSIVGSDRDAYLLSNINRWREQIGLPPIERTQLASTTAQIPLSGSDGVVATVVDLAGRMSSSSPHP